ncbi:MAG TPA: TlpA disulfide reductase family protein, partial [Candidatus Angelobacter sp.]
MSLSQSDQLETRRPTSRAMFDLLCGFIAFVAAMLVSALYVDIRPFLLATSLGFIIVGFYRGGTRLAGQSRLLTALLVALGGILPAIIVNRLRFAWTELPFLIIFTLASPLAVAVGGLLRSLIVRQRTAYAVLLGGTWALLVLVSVYKVVPAWMDSRSFIIVDRDISPFRIQTLTGKIVTSQEWKGHVVVVSFWATWCTPCNAELPEIQALRDKYRGNPSVLIVALDSAGGVDTAEIAQAYLDRKKLTIPGAIDSLDQRGDDHWGPAA